MTFLLAVLVGIAGGFTAVLPLSGSAHTSIIAALFGFKGTPEDYLMMCVFTQLGVAAALLMSNRKVFGDLGGVLALTLRGDFRRAPERPKRTLLLAGAALIPLLLGVIFRKSIAMLYNNFLFIGIALVGTGLIILSTALYIDSGTQREGKFSPGSALLTGLGQALSCLPGFSRFALVYAFMKSRGGDDKFAVRFSTIIAVPAIFGAIIINLIGTIGVSVNRGAILLYLVGAVFAFVSAMAGINLLRRLMKNGSYVYFAYYSFSMGAVVLLASLIFRK